MIRIRKYKESDAPAIASIYYNTIHTVNTRDYTEEQVNAWAPYDSVQDYSGWQEKLAKIQPFVATINDTVVGFAEFEPNGHIDCFYVHHEYQGKGIGSALMAYIFDEGKKQKIDRIYAEVSITAKPFFEAKGFKVVKEQTVNLRGVELTNFVMEINIMSNDMTNRTAYKSLCTEYYDLTKPYASGNELAFYTIRLQGKRILEAMCGSGRLLVPLLENGLAIDGVDYSKEMLASCKQRAAEKGLTPTLYEQSLEALQLPEKYDAIVIAIGSFQLIHPREKALLTLAKLKECLKPQGKLYIETFIPWEAMYENAEHEVCESNAKISDDEIIYLTSENNANKQEQYYSGKNEYKKIKNDTIISTENEEMVVCWYFRYEMQYLLEKAGFSSVIIHDVDFTQNPGGMIYEARND